ncbi:putative quinol monooxygenase [Frondihabitans cladoniiphilus]|uniref:ABM domain-containing protein n=1 Tax=Frondihabitans cladoniiphilus TaxID=715785 RepID=A0ABP8W7I3_9MICO
MIVAHMEYTYPVDKDAEMRALVPDVDAFSRQFEGNEHFQLSFADDRPGVLLGVEVWRDAATLNAHVAVAHDAPELAAWHALTTGMSISLFTATPLDVAELRAGAAA